MSDGSGRIKGRSPASLPKLKELAQVADGDYRLHWHGAISPSNRYPFHGHKLQTVFTSMDDPAVARVVTLPLGAFPHLAIGTVWSKGVFDGHDLLESKIVQITVPRRGEPSWLIRRLSDVLPEKAFPTHGLSNPSGCYIVPTAIGEELVVPHAEILRAWYFFDSAVIPAVIAGAITRPYVMPLRFLPWVPELSYLGSHRTARIVHKNRLSVASTKCLARLLFDDVARSRTVEISSAIRARMLDPAIHLPEALPPFYGPARWAVRCYEIENLEGTARRFMVQQLLSSDERVPYDRLERLPLVDLRPGTTLADELQPIIRNVTRNIFDDEGVTELTGAGPDQDLEDVTLVGITFGNSALEVPTVVPDKGEQTHKGRWKDDGEVHVATASVDPTAEPEPGTPDTTLDPEPEAPEEVNVHEIGIAATFKQIVESVANHPSLVGQSWKAELPFESAVVAVRNTSQELDRAFIIASVSNGFRNIYLMDAEPVGSEKLGRLVAFEVKSGIKLTKEHLRRWLGSFPTKPGCRWTNTESIKLDLRFERMNHQASSKGTEADTLANFKERVINRILSIID